VKCEKEKEYTMVLAVDSSACENASLFLAAVDNALSAPESEHPSVAFDCEGVNLSRAGSVEIVAIDFGKLAETDDVFLIDLGATNGISSTLRKKLKELLESQTVVKVIHDVRMDSDALFHLYGITVDNIHDTGCFHGVLTGREDISLDNLLSYYGIAATPRARIDYQKNPNYWANRPLTNQMKDRASGDVDKLLVVAEKQVSQLELRGAALMERARTLSSDACQSRDMMLARHVLCLGNVGRFIGKGGDNVRNLQRRTRTIIYKDTAKNHFMIFHNDGTALTNVKHAMGY
jgi:exonuclease 3'-5' domain-containing protein 1